ncbi:MAG TPA: D-glycero-beta-D-manno-heptose 1,7-bisphosphate 7-phosphatase [Gammaproteobacteria bacterium]|nr:D-glycero-beta-D-manno-heptose 1,7-bisphosphate 7-phosphatase [Gammaproteobacteria bacterium]
MSVIVLDRDGVINVDREDYVKSPAELEFLPGSLEAMARLSRAGHELVIATNQSGVGRGLYSMASVDAIHRHLIREAARKGARISGIYVCPHAPLAECDCRKPAPGLLRQIARDFSVPASKLIMIGDTAKDLGAAAAVGAKAILVRTGQGEATLAGLETPPQRIHANLAEAAEALLAHRPGDWLLALGSLAYNAAYLVSITIYGSICTFFAFLPGGRPGLEAVARAHARMFFRLLRPTVGLKMRIEGLENLPDSPCVLYLKHSSTWETMLPFILVRRPAFVVKRELLWIPMVGWPLARLGAIGINRLSKRRAVDQIRSQGKRLIARGHTIAIFPEGHRMPSGTTRRYGLSGALLARDCKVPIVPVAHNAGEFWPRRSFIKRPGTVRVIIGPPVTTMDRGPEAINLEAKRCIEQNMRRISVDYQAKLPPLEV